MFGPGLAEPLAREERSGSPGGGYRESVSGRPSMLVRITYIAGALALGGGVTAVVNNRVNDSAESTRNAAVLPTKNARTGNRFPPPTTPIRTVPPRTIPPPHATVAFTLPHVNRTPLPTFSPLPPIVTLPPVEVPSGQCNPHYSGCVPNDPDDVDCWGNGGNGPSYQYTEVSLLDGTDPYGLDRNHDGFGCDDP